VARLMSSEPRDLLLLPRSHNLRATRHQQFNVITDQLW